MPFCSISGSFPWLLVPRPILRAAVGTITAFVCVRAMTSTSLSSSPTRCASSTFGPSTPILSRYSMGRLPYCSRAALTLGGSITLMQGHAGLIGVRQAFGGHRTAPPWRSRQRRAWPRRVPGR